MTLQRRQFLQGTAAAAATFALPSLATAYPARPVRVIVPFAVGGPNDILARIVAEKLSARMDKQFYVENVGGAGGSIGMGQGTKAPADGHTILVVPPNLIVNPVLYASVPYDPFRDFDPVTLAVSAKIVLAVHPSVAAGHRFRARRPDQVQSFEVQLRVAGGGYAAAPCWGAVSPVAGPRPRARSLQWRCPGRYLNAGRAYADPVLLTSTSHRTHQARWSPNSGGDQPHTGAGATRCAEHVRRGLSGNRRRGLVCIHRTLGNAGTCQSHAPPGDSCNSGAA